MCIGIFTLDNPSYAFVLASNRDEFLRRPTAATTFHSFDVAPLTGEGYVLSGVDLKAGGTWLGVNKRGEVALLTDILDSEEVYSSSQPRSKSDEREHLHSRGRLVRSFLVRPPFQSIQSFVSEHLSPSYDAHAKYPGFNLLLLSPRSFTLRDGLAYDTVLITNGGKRGRIFCVHEDLERGARGISNAPEEEEHDEWMEWEKVRKGREMMSSALGQLDTLDEDREGELVERLFDLLRWSPRQTDNTLQNLHYTIQMKPFLISSKPAATRLSTVLLIRKDGSVRWVERDVFEEREDGTIAEADRADPTRQREFNFQVQNDAGRARVVWTEAH